MLGILIQIVLLAALMYIFARHEADISWPKLFMVFVPLQIATTLLSHAMGSGAFFLYLGFMIFALHQWFYLGWKKAILISLAHVLFSVGILLGFMRLTA